MATAWALLPGSFGLLNFKKSHSRPLGLLASAAWWLLLAAHPWALYQVWFSLNSHYWWLGILLLLHIAFFSVFARDLSTR